jgi:hypothetical protein
MPPEFMQILSPSYRVASSGHPRLVSGSVNQLPHTQTLTQKHTQTMMLPPSSTFNKTRQIILQKKQKKAKKKKKYQHMIFVLFSSIISIKSPTRFLVLPELRAYGSHPFLPTCYNPPDDLSLFSIHLSSQETQTSISYFFSPTKKKRILNKTRLFSNWSR